MIQKNAPKRVSKLLAIQRELLSVLVLVGMLTIGVFGEEVEIDEAKPANIPDQIVADWEAQDGTNYDEAISKIKSSLPPKYAAKIWGNGKVGFLNACHWRRVARMKPYARELKRLIYARHHDIGGAIIGYTDDLRRDRTRGVGQWGQYGCIGESNDYSSGNKNGT
ncbi:MAG: hypothetical protein N3D72_02955, partial [Candidatus Methanomethyliaceae archaeon]|nr:hypothetical protein [Candidatus Methanomethyliaceae archaeon]